MNTENKLKIAFFQSDLHVGGIQRALVNYLWLFQKDERFLIDVFLFDDADVFYAIPKADHIRVHYFKRFLYLNRIVPFRVLYSAYGSDCRKKIRSVMKENDIDRYDLAIDFNSYWNECAIFTLVTPAKKHVCWVHNDVKVKLNEEWKYRLLHLCFEEKYSMYDSMVMVSSGTVDPFYQVNQKAVTEHCVISNPINTDEICEKVKCVQADETIQVNPEKINLVSVGRLCHQKGFDLLLEEIAILKEKCTAKNTDPMQYHFHFIGNGPDRERLQEQALHLGVGQMVSFHGNQENPFAIMKKCDAFVMMARYEGQPLAYWEAKTLRLPIIIPMHLEQYTEGLPGCENVAEEILKLKKRPLIDEIDEIREYNGRIKERLVFLAE